MVEKVLIRGFKALAEVEVELGVLNVFIGPNGAGKTSLLEAVGLLSAAVSGHVDEESLSRRGVRLGQPAVYKIALQNAGSLPRYIHLEAIGNGYHYRVDLDNPIERPSKSWRFANEWFGKVGERKAAFASRSPRSEISPYVGVVPAVIDLPESAVAFRDALRGYRIFAPQTPMLRGTSPDTTAKAPLGLGGGGLAEAVEEMLAGNSDARSLLLDSLRDWFDWVAEVKVVPPSKLPIPPSVPMTRRVLAFTDKYSRRGRNLMTAYDASEGVLHALFLMVLVMHPEALAFAAVDNFGYGLHPRLKRALVSRVADWLLEKNNRQLVLTTHDPLVLDGLPLLDDRVRLFVVDRDSAGRVVVRRVLVDEELWRKKEERGWAMSDLWVEGWLGGVPNLW